MTDLDVDLFGEEVRTLDGTLRALRPGMGSHHPQAGTSETDEWLTPPWLLNRLGPFDLDPCSPGVRRPWDTAARHYALEDDGLRQPWAGRVWLNPPYSDARPWLLKLAAHGNGTALIFARVETRTWFDLVWPRATAVLFLRGRLTFHHVNGRAGKANAGAPSALIAYGPRDAERLAMVAFDLGHLVPLEDA